MKCVTFFLTKTNFKTPSSYPQELFQIPQICTDIQRTLNVKKKKIMGRHDYIAVEVLVVP